ncbi:MAG: hypothetical protein J6V72_06215, partial [Kiritimatiellae bacterium]|nr:hypothetical protein [Kiritimatiellia bacterium]
MANLTQLKMLEDLDGVLLVDKPAGIAFSTVVKTVKRKFGLVKVGHGGSLDAMATGLLVILLGDAKKFASDVMGADRSWSGSLRFGETTDTGDRYGRPVPLPARVMQPSEAKGDLFQVEPRFCSVRREGSAEYEVADTGEHTQFLAHVGAEAFHFLHIPQGEGVVVATGEDDGVFRQLGKIVACPVAGRGLARPVMLFPAVGSQHAGHGPEAD